MKPAQNLDGFGGGAHRNVGFFPSDGMPQKKIPKKNNTSPLAAPFLRGEDFVSWGVFRSPQFERLRPQEIVTP